IVRRDRQGRKTHINPQVRLKNREERISPMHQREIGHERNREPRHEPCDDVMREGVADAWRMMTLTSNSRCRRIAYANDSGIASISSVPVVQSGDENSGSPRSSCGIIQYNG